MTAHEWAEKAFAEAFKWDARQRSEMPDLYYAGVNNLAVVIKQAVHEAEESMREHCASLCCDCCAEACAANIRKDTKA